MGKNNINKFSHEFAFQDYFQAVLYAFIIVVIPLIVHLVEVPTTNIEALSGYLQPTTNDAFSYYKRNWIVFSGMILLFFHIAEFFTVNKEYDWKVFYKDPIFVSAILYCVLVIVSYIASPYKELAWHGAFERYENLFVLLSYMVIFLSMRNFIRTKQHVRYILFLLMFSALLVGGIGIFQFYGLDFWMSSLGKWLIVGSEGPDINAVYDGFVYTSLYNPNCVGSFTNILIPLMLLAGLVYPLKSPAKYGFLVGFIFVVHCMVGCRSTGGYLGIAFQAGIFILIGIYLLLSMKQPGKKNSLFCTGLGAIVLLAIVFLFVGKSIWTPYFNALLKIPDESRFPIKDVQVVENSAVFDTVQGKLYFSYEKDLNLFLIYDENHVAYEPVHEDREAFDGGTMVVYTYNMEGFNVQAQTAQMVNEDTYGQFRLQHLNMNFVVQENESIIATSQAMEPIDINEPVKSIGFEGYEKIASQRGFIWSRSLPLVGKYFLFGSGPDTFMVVFPQDDIKGKMVHMGSTYIIVDKPHNFYLQTAINTGFISLLAILALFGQYIYEGVKSTASLKLFQRDRWLWAVGFGLFLGICGYLMTMMATDSTVSVSPIFWCVLGLGFGVNKLMADAR